MKILLLGEKTFLADTAQKKLSTQFGDINLAAIKRYGQRVTSTKGYSFVATEPTIIDLLRKCTRGPQVVLPRDAAHIVAMTGARPGWRCLDCGSGSGFLALFLGTIVKPGSVVTYERNKVHAQIVAKNIVFCGLSNVVTVKHKDIMKGFTEKKLDLITLDLQDADKIITQCHVALKPGGWLCVYSPHIEQQIKARKACEKLPFIDITTVENTRREWTSLKGYTHPRYGAITHTGFMTFARKSE